MNQLILCCSDSLPENRLGTRKSLLLCGLKPHIRLKRAVWKCGENASCLDAEGGSLHLRTSRALCASLGGVHFEPSGLIPLPWLSAVSLIVEAAQ